MRGAWCALLGILAGGSAAFAQGSVAHVATLPIQGEYPFTFHGISCGGAGDVNADGYDDFVVGARSISPNPFDEGRVRVYSGRDASILYTFIGDSFEDRLGSAVGGAGDVNNDGFADFMAGAPNDDDNGSNCGSIRVYSGADGAVLFTFYGDSAGDQIGQSVHAPGDVNNDGFDDILVAAPFDDNNGSNSGSVRIYSGADGSVLHFLNGSSAGEQFGVRVSGAGDTNNDGCHDFIVGDPNHDAQLVDMGKATLYSGADGSVLRTIIGATVNTRLGSTVSGAGDLNGDGYDDFAVVFTQSAQLRARVYSGLDGSSLLLIGPGVAGSGLRSAGDIDNDGVPDMVVPSAGRVVSGATGSVLYALGVSLVGAGDLNNDGYDDLVSGSGSDSSFLPSAGSVTVYLSAPAFGTVTPAQCSGDATNDRVVDFNDIVAVLGNWSVVCP